MSHSRGELRRAAPLACIASVLAWSTLAHADPPEVRARLTYVVMPGAEACPGERVVREQVGLRLGYDPFHEDGAEHVTVRLSPRPGGLHAAISVEQQPSQAPASRELDSEGAGCDELLRSLVLTVSLAIDPLSLTRAPRASTAPTPTPAPTKPAPPAPAPAPASPPPPKRAPWNIELAGALRGGYGLLPGGGSLGPVVDLRVGKAGWAVFVEGGADLPTGHASTPATVGTVSASLLRGGVGACALPAWFMVCAQVDAGELQGTGQGAGKVSGLNDASFYLDAAAAAGVNLRIAADVHVQILANLVVPITRTTLNLPTTSGVPLASPAWTSSTLAGLLSAGVAYRF